MIPYEERPQEVREEEKRKPANEYERLKYQLDEILEKQQKEVANKVATLIMARGIVNHEQIERIIYEELKAARMHR